MKTFLFVLLLGAALPASAAEWYVATDGDDAADGSSTSPFATIGHAIASASAGDTIIVAAGEYDQGATVLTIDKENLTLRAADGARPHIKATLDGPFAAVYFEEDNCDGSLLQGFEISGGRNGVQVGSSWTHDTLYDGEVREAPIDELTCDDITIHDNVIHDMSREGIKLPAGVRNITITSNEIFNTGMPAETNAECIDAVSVINLHVAGNYLHHCASNGAYAKGGSRNAVFEYNLVTDVGQNVASGQGLVLGYTTTDYDTFDLENNPGCTRVSTAPFATTSSSTRRAPASASTHQGMRTSTTTRL